MRRQGVRFSSSDAASISEHRHAVLTSTAEAAVTQLQLRAQDRPHHLRRAATQRRVSVYDASPRRPPRRGKVGTGRVGNPARIGEQAREDFVQRKMHWKQQAPRSTRAMTLGSGRKWLLVTRAVSRARFMVTSLCRRGGGHRRGVLPGTARPQHAAPGTANSSTRRVIAPVLMPPVVNRASYSLVTHTGNRKRKHRARGHAARRRHHTDAGARPGSNTRTSQSTRHTQPCRLQRRRRINRRSENVSREPPSTAARCRGRPENRHRRAAAPRSSSYPPHPMVRGRRAWLHEPADEEERAGIQGAATREKEHQVYGFGGPQQYLFVDRFELILLSVEVVRARRQGPSCRRLTAGPTRQAPARMTYTLIGRAIMAADDACRGPSL